MRVQKNACNNLITEARVSKSTPLSNIMCKPLLSNKGGYSKRVSI